MTARALLRRAAPVAMTALLSMPSGACGFLFSHAPPGGHQQMDYFTCTESNAGPIIDIVWAGLNVAGALAAASDPDAYDNSGQIVAVGVSWGILSSAAAAVGFGKSSKCREAKRALAMRQAQRQNVAPAPAPPDDVVHAVVVAPAADTLAVGQQLQLRAWAYNSSGAAIPNKVYRWSSSNDAVASVSNAGLVTARAPGSVIVAANADNVVGTASILVVTPMNR